MIRMDELNKIRKAFYTEGFSINVQRQFFLTSHGRYLMPKIHADEFETGPFHSFFFRLKTTTVFFCRGLAPAQRRNHKRVRGLPFSMDQKMTFIVKIRLGSSFIGKAIWREVKINIVDLCW